MSDAQQLSLAIDKPHRNQYLFSDHYLEEILRREKAWTAAQPAAADFLSFLRSLHAAEGAHLADYNEAQLEENWIKPILSHLGHKWEPQASVPGMDKSIKKPDYVFFPDDDTRKAAVADQRTEEYARHALAVGEVKAWPVNLSRKTAGAPTFDNNNPMFQIDYYLKATGVAWGIASNGRFWRLVHKDSSYRLDRYFEIDLPAALNTADERRALAVATYFTLFFGRAAFARDESGRVFLDDVLKGSRTYAVALESDLRDNAYKALEQIILGFFAPAANGLDPNDEGDRAAVYRNSLLLLYRLLFLFYGESRGLLPMPNKAYRDRSLTELARATALLVDNHQVDSLPPMTGTYWARYKELFAIIDGRDAGLNAFLGVPRYNGGLFDPARHAFLENKIVGERHLVRAIDYLARRRKTENGRFAGYESVDYRTLGVRQLGSIYEGLLEYKVSVAAEAMVTVRKGGKETWLPARERGKTKVIETKQPGELYLATDKGERKATGSYYTPDYIVKYIVEQALGPLVEEARQKIRDTKYEIREKAARFEEAILSLNILDPAMGSGHFLVDATNFLARALATDEYVMARGEESDLTYWKRRVVEACIYGVDKNELAVELAKLSLWLETVAADKPLSFLDHHLRHGDSLIGARLSDLERAPAPARPQRSSRPLRSESADPLFDESAFTTSAGLAVGGAARIEAILTDDLDAVHDKERILREIQEEHLARWRRLADLWVSAWFGNAMSAEEYRDLALRIQGKPGAAMSDEQAARYLNHPAVVANDYFHWELAFPEVFFDAYGRPKGEKAGFDAVVGNPPYVSAWSMTEANPNIRTTIQGLAMQNNLLGAHWDLYIPFFLRAYEFTRRSGLFSFIVPNPFCREKYATEVRRYLLENTYIKSIVPFGEENVFDEVSRQTLVIVFQKQEVDWTKATIKIENPSNLLLVNSTDSNARYIPQIQFYNLPNYQLRHEVTASEFKILDKIDSNSIYLGTINYVNYGAQVSSKERGGFGKEQVISKEKKGNYKKFFEGKNLSRYHVNWSGWYLDYQPEIMYGPRDPILFESPKIIIRHISGENDSLLVGYDKDGLYCDHGLVLTVGYDFIAGTNLRSEFEGFQRVNQPYDQMYLLAIVASRLLTFYYGLRFATGSLQGSFSHVYPQHVRQLPIHRIHFVTPRDERAKILSQCQVNYQEFCRDIDQSRVTDIIDSYLNDTVSDIVHDFLAYLAEQMIAMHKEKQALTADFWTDLEGASAPADFRKLRDKGKQEAGLAADAALAPFVRAESKSARTLDESLAWDEAAFKAFVRALAGPVDGLSRLVKVYQQHAPRYRELVERIGRTDWLIDQIVYKLYGLTEEEIAIVEGRVG